MGIRMKRQAADQVQRIVAESGLRDWDWTPVDDMLLPPLSRSSFHSSGLHATAKRLLLTHDCGLTWKSRRTHRPKLGHVGFTLKRKIAADRDLAQINCSACVLNGYGTKKGEAPNYAGWARVFIQAQHLIEAELLLKELTRKDNDEYVKAMIRDLKTWYPRYVHGL